jgi:transcriptional regulator with XRE-family HTH domain
VRCNTRSMNRQKRGETPSQSRPGDPVAEFAARLRDLRAQAGSPPFRQLAKVTHYSSSTLAEATRGKRLPSEAVLRAFVTGCGAQPDEWLARLRRAAAASTAAQATVNHPEPARTAMLNGRLRYTVNAAAALALLVTGGMLGAMIQHGQKPDLTRTPRSALAEKRATDGADPIVAGCVKDARLVDKSPVLLHGHQIGALEMIYSARCAAAWARIYLYPGQPSMLGQVTIKASDGRLASFANPLIKQIAVYTDVITAAPGECLGAEAGFRSAHVSAHAVVSCQNPAS